MTAGDDLMTGRAADLRRAFDRSFSEPAVVDESAVEGLLALGCGGDAYAVRLAEIGGLLADQTLVRLPSAVSEFMGVVGVRHDVVPVYSLRELLGQARGGDHPRWLMVARGAHPVAFAFEEFDGYFQVAPSAVFTAEDAVSAHVPATVRLPGGLRGVVSIASLLGTIEDRIRRIGTTEEQ